MAELSSPAAVIEIGTAAPWVRKWSSLPWVRGPLWDGFWMLSALWLAPIVLLLAHGYSNPESSPLDLLYFGLTALFWIGHRLSSTYLAYCTEAYRPLLREQPIRFVVLPIAHNSRMFCAVSSGRLSVAMDARGTTDWTGDHRLRLRDVPFRRATFRCAFTLPFASGSQLLYSDKALGSLFCADCWRRACVCRGYPGWSGRVSRSVGRSLVSGVDCIS